MTAGRARRCVLRDGRLHLQDGPIDLIIGADGPPEAVAGAHDAAAATFAGLLDVLCIELPLMRAPAGDHGPPPRGPVARRMAAAVAPFARKVFITPMAAVAGAVADEVLAAMMCDPGILRAYVNNGGDIALHCAPGQHFTVGIVDRPDYPSLLGHVRVGGDGVGGIATSGWRGRSFSLGIADSVTVLARSAAEADAAATVIANAVDLPGHPAVARVPAQELQPDSDLGPRRVTRDVGALTEREINCALGAGLARAEDALANGLILGAALQLQGRVRATRTFPCLDRPAPSRPALVTEHHRHV